MDEWKIDQAMAELKMYDVDVAGVKWFGCGLGVVFIGLLKVWRLLLEGSCLYSAGMVNQRGNILSL